MSGEAGELHAAPEGSLCERRAGTLLAVACGVSALARPVLDGFDQACVLPHSDVDEAAPKARQDAPGQLASHAASLPTLEGLPEGG